MAIPITVTLTWPEVNAACQVALFRQTHNHMRGLETNYGCDPNFCIGVGLHTQGCIAEIAVAKHFNRYWSGVEHMRAPDVGYCLEVKSTRDLPGRRMIVHEESDHNADRVVFATVADNPRIVCLHGWMAIADAKDKKYWWHPEDRPEGAAYFVPREDLLPLDELKAILISEGK